MNKFKSFFEPVSTFFEKNYWLNVVSRWLVGLVFLFSAFVKGVDPMGTMFKIEEYMSNWTLFGSSFEWAHPFAGFLSVALICAEFLTGILLIFNSFRVLSAWLLALMMAFFTVTTFVDALTNMVDDCGCFGDAIKLTNWQTFWKNVVLDVFAVIIFCTRKQRYRRRFERDIIVMVAALAVMIVFCIYNIKHEPVIDFRPWKIGNTMVKHQEPMNYIKYTNKETGESVELKYKNGEYASHMEEWSQYDNEDIWQYDTSWTTPEFEVLAKGFSMLTADEYGVLSSEQTLNVLPDSNGVLVVTVYDLTKLDDDDVKEVKNAVAVVQEYNKAGHNIRIAFLTSMGGYKDNPLQKVQMWLSDNKIDGIQVNVPDMTGENNVYFTDATAIKTIMRGNPGFMYMRDGVVIDKERKADKLKIEK
jgi:hypothetical protein